MVFNWLLPLRVAQAVFTIIVLGLASFVNGFNTDTRTVSNWWTNHWFATSPAEINFLIFSSVWTLLVLGYVLVAPWKFPAAAHKYAVLAVEVLTMLFWFAGFIAIAVWLDNRVCFGSVCNSARVATAFAAFEWAIFVGTTTLAALHVWHTRSTAQKGSAPEMEAQNA